MKRYLILLLSTVIIFNTITLSAATLDTEYSCADINTEIKLLDYLGAFDNRPDDNCLNDFISREKFARMLGGAIGCKNDTSVVNSYYTDTDSVYVNYLTEQRVFCGTEKNIFEPNSEITYFQAISVILRLTGYDRLADARGGGINEYMRLARQTGICSEKDGNAKVDFYNAIELIYNGLRISLYETQSVMSDSGVLNGVYSAENGVTLLEKLYDIHYVKGRMTANGYTDIYSGEPVNKLYVKIEDDEYYIGYSEDYRYIGQTVEAFYIAHKDYGKKEIVVISSGVQNPQIKTIYADDISKYDKSGSKLEYYGENGKKITVGISNNVPLIYNGSAYNAKYDDIFNFDLGYVTLYMDGSKVDAVSVTSAENLVVKRNGLNDDIIYAEKVDGTERNIDLKDMEYNVYSGRNGEKLALMNIVEGDIISAVISKDNKNADFYLCSKRAEGILEKVSDKDGRKYFVIDGTEYKQSKQAMECGDIALREKYRCYFDFTDSIVKIEKVRGQGEDKYGYLYAIGQEDEFEETIKVKIFNEYSQHETLVLKGKITIDGERGNADEVKNKLINPVTGKLERTLVKYSENSKGEIKKIEFPASGLETRKTDKSLYMISPKSVKNFSYEYYTMNGIIPIDTTTKFFIVPDTSIENPQEKDFSIWNYSRWDAPFDNNYPTECYKFDENTPNMDIGVVYIDKLKHNNGVPILMLVDSIITVASPDGGTQKIIQGFVHGAITSIYVAPECNTDNIQSGDIIRYMTNAANEIGLVSIVMDYDVPSTWVNNISKDTAGQTVFELINYVGDICKIDRCEGGDEVNICIGKGNDIKNYITVNPNKIKVVVYDRESKSQKLRWGSIDDAKEYSLFGDECSKIFIQDLGSFFKIFILYL